jgi:hypothetical protein
MKESIRVDGESETQLYVEIERDGKFYKGFVSTEWS